MRFSQTELAGVWSIELDRLEDERGWFARTFDAEEFRTRRMDPSVVQCNLSFNDRAGTLRGLHYQAEPYGEPKLVRCSGGAIYDVALDLRAGSPSYRRWFALELTAANGRMLYMPPGVAHGFQTLVDASEVLYQMGARYSPDAAAGVRWDDPAFAISWPEPPHERTISERDRSYAAFTP
ncbi:MAG: dTDP-4-dehydrorhamnose 3,5-epimerase [Solirubrobacterales bacterium]|nr:MAG: dTDP-4-dehydrorhamnose 3,5-epimerase [Solirubrobacterales bacterium]